MNILHMVVLLGRLVQKTGMKQQKTLFCITLNIMESIVLKVVCFLLIKGYDAPNDTEAHDKEG